MQKVIQSSWKSEHSYAHSHWGESPHLCTVQKVIQTNWKIDGAHIHRQWGKATQLNWVQKVIQKSWNLGQTFAYAHWGKAPPLYRVWKIIGWNGGLKNHMLSAHPQWREVAHIYAQSVKSQTKKVAIWELISSFILVRSQFNCQIQFKNMHYGINRGRNEMRNCCLFCLCMWLMRIKIFTCASRCACPDADADHPHEPHGSATAWPSLASISIIIPAKTSKQPT